MNVIISTEAILIAISKSTVFWYRSFFFFIVQKELVKCFRLEVISVSLIRLFFQPSMENISTLHFFISFFLCLPKKKMWMKHVLAEKEHLPCERERESGKNKIYEIDKWKYYNLTYDRLIYFHKRFTNLYF